MPQHDYQTKHITIDSEDIQKIYNFFRNRGEKIIPADVDSVWQNCLNFDKIHKTDAMRFDRWITTNGESVSVHFIKIDTITENSLAPSKPKKSQGISLRAKRKKQPPPVTNIIPQEVKDVLPKIDKFIGLDPGYKLAALERPEIVMVLTLHQMLPSKDM